MSTKFGFEKANIADKAKKDDYREDFTDTTVSKSRGGYGQQIIFVATMEQQAALSGYGEPIVCVTPEEWDKATKRAQKGIASLRIKRSEKSKSPVTRHAPSPYWVQIAQRLLREKTLGSCTSRGLKAVQDILATERVAGAYLHDSAFKPVVKGSQDGAIVLAHLNRGVWTAAERYAYLNPTGTNRLFELVDSDGAIYWLRCEVRKKSKKNESPKRQQRALEQKRKPGEENRKRVLSNLPPRD